jgi:hypothetical protein
MSKRISMEVRQELVRAISERYRSGTRNEKLRILDEFVRVTGYHRKHAIRILNVTAEVAPRRPSMRLRLYDEAVRQALIVLCEASDRVCGKRLKPLLSLLVPALERHGHLTLDKVVREKVFAMSAATMDRMLAATRAATGGGRARAKTVPAIRRSIPVRTFADWGTPAPGFMEGDLVAHCGEDASGSFLHTLTLTDIASGWTECVALVVRQSTLVVEALTQLRTTMPFPLRGFDSDNGSEFVNESVLAFCTEHGVEFTRSRPYRKNDQAWVEQKNGAIVRRLVGYRRLEGLAAADALARLYAASRLFINFFQPSFKLAEKTRVGARVRKRYHSPATPCARLLAHESIPEVMKERLRTVAAALDPLQLLDEVRTMQHHLVIMSTVDAPHSLPQPTGDLDRFFKSLATAWQDGEVRPTHRAEPKPARDWRTRADPFEAAWPQVRAWLDAEPDRTARELFDRLQGANPGVFPDGQLRTLQRRVKEWRCAAVRRLVFRGSDVVTGVDLTAAPGMILPTWSGSTFS